MGRFSKKIDVVLSSAERQIDRVYLVNNMPFSWNLEEHVKHTFHLAPLSRDVVVSWKLKQYAFYTYKINYLVFVTRPKFFEVVKHTRDAIQKLQLPATLTKL